jgi:hypothetical protein
MLVFGLHFLSQAEAELFGTCMNSPSIGKDAKMKCPKDKVEEELLGGELLADQFTVSKLAGHLGLVVSVFGIPPLDS